MKEEDSDVQLEAISAEMNQQQTATKLTEVLPVQMSSSPSAAPTANDQKAAQEAQETLTALANNAGVNATADVADPSHNDDPSEISGPVVASCKPNETAYLPALTLLASGSEVQVFCEWSDIPACLTPDEIYLTSLCALQGMETTSETLLDSHDRIPSHAQRTCLA
jgi:hypothetical protein